MLQLHFCTCDGWPDTVRGMVLISFWAVLHVCDTLYSVAQRLACARLSVSANKQKKQTRRQKQATKNDGKRDGKSLWASFRIPQSAHYSVPWPLPEKPLTGSTSVSPFNSHATFLQLFSTCFIRLYFKYTYIWHLTLYCLSDNLEGEFLVVYQ